MKTLFDSPEGAQLTRYRTPLVPTVLAYFMVRIGKSLLTRDPYLLLFEGMQFYYMQLCQLNHNDTIIARNTPGRLYMKLEKFHLFGSNRGAHEVLVTMNDERC